MILLLSSTKDDILYFDTVIKNRKEEKILGKYDVIIGTIFNQPVMLLKDVYTSYLSSALVTYIIKEYFVILVIALGKCRSFGGTLKLGDIAFSKQIILGDVDQVAIETEKVKICQIPGFDQTFPTNVDTLDTLNKAINKFSSKDHYECTFISSNVAYENENQFSNIVSSEHQILGIDGNVVFDGESGGAALACHLQDVPFVSVKVCEGQFGKKLSLDDYIHILRTYAIVGKIVTSFIGDIGRSDLADN